MDSLLNKKVRKSFKYFFIGCLIQFIGFNSLQAQPFAFLDEITAFKKSDSVNHPPKNVILFVGSSSFRMWKNIQQDFPGYTIINRGFGGSTLPDVMYYANDIIFPYMPRQIVIYVGENDLASSDTVTAQSVVNRFKSLFYLIRNRMNEVPIVFVSIKPSPSREKLLPKIKEANRGIKLFLKKKMKVSYVDVFHKMLTPKGLIRGELFIEDQLHMNNKGYEIWKNTIRPYLLKD